MKKTSAKVSAKPPIPVRAVDFVMYNVKDAAKARAWYQKLFGLKRGGEWTRFWSEFATEPVTLCLNGTTIRPEDKWEWSGTPAIAFAVEDIHAAAKECRKRRVKILKGPVETSVCWMLFVEDPDGNRIVIHQRKDGSCG